MCCALPALLVTLGMGASLAGLIGIAPWITGISRYKPVIFSVAGVLLILAGWLQWRGRYAPCPADPLKAKACARLRTVSWMLWLGAVGVYAVGFFFAFLGVLLL